MILLMLISIATISAQFARFGPTTDAVQFASRTDVTTVIRFPASTDYSSAISTSETACLASPSCIAVLFVFSVDDQAYVALLLVNQPQGVTSSGSAGNPKYLSWR